MSSPDATNQWSSSSEWLEADGLGGYASATASGQRTRRYHALLLTATTPPTGRMVLVNGLDAVVQSASDLFLGWTVGPEGRHFYVRQLNDMKVKMLVELFSPSVLRQYAELCGWALALAHARSGQPAKIAGYLGKSDKFDEAIADFSLAYADQSERDHKVLVKAVREGRLKVVNE